MQSQKLVLDLTAIILTAILLTASPRIARAQTASSGIARVQTGAGASDGISGFYQGTAKMASANSHDIEFVIEIRNQNGTLSGNAEVEGGRLPLTGTYSNGAVTIKLKPGGELTITARLIGDRINGTWEMEGGRTGALEMKRVSAGWQEVHDMIAQARAGQSTFKSAGGKSGHENNPAEKWSKRLLDYGRQHPGASESKDAETVALALLLDAGLIADAATISAQVDSSGELWGKQVMNQLWAAEAANDNDYAVRNADALVDHSSQPELKAQIRLAEGDAFWRKGDTGRATSVFRGVMDEYPKTRFAEEARGNIYEIEKLNVGHPAPVLNAKFVDGHGANLTDYRGKPVLIVFWASW
ncbi:MAG TPA: hypothetical protein VEZ90_17695 [Blastocatellia bacterium]|nr:hypothetical protein [Blastocatellia bacterium]